MCVLQIVQVIAGHKNEKRNQALNDKKEKKICSKCIVQVIAGGKGLARLSALLRGEEVRSQGELQRNLF